jgi:regulator of PEP synthase PpsR (kinase-PPPase family)
MSHRPTPTGPARPVFYVSDGTGITVETMGSSLLTRFAGMPFITTRLAFVDDVDKAKDARDRIRAADGAGGRAIVVHSIVDPAIIAILAESGALLLDVFAPFIASLEKELGAARQLKVGQAHAMQDFESYHRRIEAMNFALAYDDGVAVSYDDADLILVAVSRAGKTPTCVYLALHYGIRAANHPLIDEDLETDRLPPRLRQQKHKLFGLTIEPQRLHQIRQVRRPNSPYADIDTCRREVAAAEAIFAMERIPSLSTTHTSIEEIASKVVSALGLQRGFY